MVLSIFGQVASFASCYAVKELSVIVIAVAQVDLLDQW